MNIKIHSAVTFELAGDRTITLEARELAEFYKQLYATKGRPGAKPEDPRLLDWATIVADTKAFVKEKTGVDITDGEATGIFDNADHAWSTIRKNWLPPTEESVSSAPSSDPRYSD